MGFLSHFKNILNKRDKTRINKYDKGLKNTREELVNKLNILGIKYTKIDDRLFDELEEILIMADLGVKTTLKLVDKIKTRVKQENITDFKYLKEVIVDELLLIYVNNEVLSSKLNINDKEISVILFVGVNGVGKTTSIAKIASKMKKLNKKVLLIAADTFRAGATEQLKLWSEKVQVNFFGKENSDPASVVYDGIKKAQEENIDIVLIDTAGRLHNKVNLMNELKKINKVIKSLIPSAPQETLLVIDATTGQNAVEQAKSFKEIIDVTGIILTKLDSTAKGGIILAIKENVSIPVKFVGLGEKEEDLVPFDIEEYIYSLFKDWE